MLARYRGLPPVDAARLAREGVRRRARAREPGMKIALHRLPRHGVQQRAPLRRLHARAHGAHRSGWSSRCWSTRSPARSSASRAPPWYLNALLLSQPLHFGDYGGVPMQWLWAALDVAHDHRAGQRRCTSGWASAARCARCSASDLRQRARDEGVLVAVGLAAGDRDPQRASGWSAGWSATAAGTGWPGSAWACRASRRRGSGCADGVDSFAARTAPARSAEPLSRVGSRAGCARRPSTPGEGVCACARSGAGRRFRHHRGNGRSLRLVLARPKTCVESIAARAVRRSHGRRAPEG